MINHENKPWIPYRMDDVVDTNGPRFAVRNYIEQRDLRSALIMIKERATLERAVEFGCGYGRMTQVLTEFASRVVGFEREEEFTKVATSLIPEADFVQVNDLAQVPLENDFADAVVTFTFLQHLINSQAEKVAKEILRVLSPSGHVLICEETDESHIAGATNDPMGQCTIGRSVEKYAEFFQPFTLIHSSPRRIEPGYPRANTGTYMLFG